MVFFWTSVVNSINVIFDYAIDQTSSREKSPPAPRSLFSSPYISLPTKRVKFHIIPEMTSHRLSAVKLKIKISRHL